MDDFPTPASPRNTALISYFSESLIGGTALVRIGGSQAVYAFGSLALFAAVATHVTL